MLLNANIYDYCNKGREQKTLIEALSLLQGDPLPAFEPGGFRCNTLRLMDKQKSKFLSLSWTCEKSSKACHLISSLNLIHSTFHISSTEDTGRSHWSGKKKHKQDTHGNSSILFFAVSSVSGRVTD